MFLNEFLRVAVNRVLKFDNAPMVSDILGGGTAWSSPALQQYRFLQSRTPHRLFSGATAIFAVGPTLLVLSLVYWNIVTVSLRSFGSTAPWSAPLSIAALLMIAYPIAHVGFTFVPFTFSKNVGFIRWVFLYPIYRRSLSIPPHVRAWSR
jgi:hypothetical protein